MIEKTKESFIDSFRDITFFFCRFVMLFLLGWLILDQTKVKALFSRQSDTGSWQQVSCQGEMKSERKGTVTILFVDISDSHLT